MFQKILIANRGEIAVRIIRACHEMGIRVVAVYSEADRNSLHVKYADEAYCIGKGPARESYLNIPQIIAACEISDAEAIHPGYGFLAENAHFAEVCEASNIKFIGPKHTAINQMGNKANARRLAQECGVPTVPGSKDVVKTVEEAQETAKKIGYPVIIKASAGGGGRGMRVVHTQISLPNAFSTAQAEAQACFNCPDVYIERYISQPRHVEVQVMADERGSICHLGERDCTIQRRHQKLVEESPSPVVDGEMRRRMGDAACAIARAAEYTSAGTIEFLVDETGSFYFMEMNTRVQVEHCVTELATGIDIVKEQLAVAAGEPLSFKQEDVTLQGWTIECRINAEDAERNFRPSPGTITKYLPPGGPGVRVDSAAYAAYTIPPLYDSMIAKLIVHGRTRISAIRRMLRALGEFQIEGIATTIPFHRNLIKHPAFVRGTRYSTHFVDEWLAKGIDLGPA
ncbi:acetyl-CoA carboxylase biotin carboxylase subunit [bacterium]|nr:acetyl-CoA carboxylase biotin carboxylase subunit [bacterium]